MTVRERAFHDACRAFGVKVADESPGVAVYPEKDVATDPALEKLRWASGIDTATEANRTMDRATPDMMPDSGTINRTEG